MTEIADSGQIPITVDGEPAGFAQADEQLVAVVKRFMSANGAREAVVYSGETKLMTPDGSKTLRALSILALDIYRPYRRYGSCGSDPAVPTNLGKADVGHA